jgi:protein-S-isoprenylcysteine O-methyltransferase Ste14
MANVEFDWAKPIDKDQNRKYDLPKMYDRAHSELSLQQSKRDQIITVYIALCAFLFPFVFEMTNLPMLARGFVFLFVGVIGILFSMIVIRYREYKEIYWTCCQTLSVLMCFQASDIDKSTIQRAFYHCLKERVKSYIQIKDDKEVFDKSRYVWDHFKTFKSETLYFTIIASITSAVCAVGIGFMLLVIKPLQEAIIWIIVLAIIAFLIILVALLFCYFRRYIKLYDCVAITNKKGEEDDEKRDKAFKSLFKRAWFLHMYYDGNEDIK